MRLPVVVSEYAASAKEYLGQAVRGGPERGSSSLQSGGMASGESDWMPPVNSFTLKGKGKERVAESSSLPRRDVDVSPRDLECERRRLRNGSDELDHHENPLRKQKRHSEHTYDPGEHAGPFISREYPEYHDYDPLGHSGQWKRAHELEQRTRERKKRVKDEWKNREEKECNPDRWLPQLRVGGEVMKQTPFTRRTEHGLTGGVDEEEKYGDGFRKQRLHTLGGGK